jgi:hypothetical protein
MGGFEVNILKTKLVIEMIQTAFETRKMTPKIKKSTLPASVVI